MSSLYWTLDLEKELANLIGHSISTLVKGATTTEDENHHQKWLDSKLLSAGLDLDAPTGLEAHRKEFLDELVNLPNQGESEAVVLATYMHRHITAKKPLASIGGDLGNAPPLPPNQNQNNRFPPPPPSCALPVHVILELIFCVAVAKVERAAVAVLLRHNQLINEAMTFAHWLTNNPSALEVADKAPLPPSLQMVWEVAYEVRVRLVQLQHKHRLAQQEGDAEIRYETFPFVSSMSSVRLMSEISHLVIRYSATAVYEQVCGPVLKKIEFLLTVRVPEARASVEQNEQADERDRLSRSSSSMLVKKGATERKALTSSVESGGGGGNTPRILRARSTGTLKRSKPRGADGVDDASLLDTDAVASPTERRRRLLERKDTNENQRRVQESFKMWKLFRDRSKEAQSANAIDPAQDSVISDAVVAFIMDDKLEPSGLLNGMRQRETRAQGRIYGLRTMASLLTQISLRSVQHDLLLALLRGFKSDHAGHVDTALERHHYMHLAQACQSGTRDELERTFQMLYTQLASMLRGKETEAIVKVLLMQLWTLGFREEDHGFVQKVGILPILKKLACEDAALGSSQDAGDPAGARSGLDSGFAMVSMNLNPEQAEKKEIAKAAGWPSACSPSTAWARRTRTATPRTRPTAPSSSSAWPPPRARLRRAASCSSRSTRARRPSCRPWASCRSGGWS